MSESLNSIAAKAEGEYSKEAVAERYKSGLAVLDELAGSTLKVDELFADRQDGGTQVLKPPPMTMKQLAMHANREVEANEQKVEFTRTFKARPADGAFAFHAVLKKVFGINAIGKTIPPSFFSAGQKPEYKSVQIDAIRDPKTGKVREEFIDVPWGLMSFAPLDATFNLYYTLDNDYGFCFTVAYEAPKKHQSRVKALFDAVEEYLSTTSIYKGKVLEGVGSADPKTGVIIDPKIIEPYNTDRHRIVYTDVVNRALNNSVWGPIRSADALRKNGIPLGEKILLEGPNGSGKTEALMAAFQIALENGWTAIKCRYDEDIAKVIAFAERLGGPVVIGLEDVEKLANPVNTGSPEKMEQLLDLFDGAGAKGREVMLVMTSNHAHELTKSMSRPGRIDRIVKVGALDREALERLVKVIVGEERLGDVDFDALDAHFPECTPVWIVQAIRRAERAVIIRTGEAGSKFETEDLLYEADDLVEQLLLHNKAKDRKDTPALEQALATLVAAEVAKATQPIETKLDEVHSATV